MRWSGGHADSRAVQPGYLFAALPGAKMDGRSSIGEAVKRGAAAVLAPPGTDLGDERADPKGGVIRLITDSNPLAFASTAIVSRAWRSNTPAHSTDIGTDTSRSGAALLKRGPFR